MRRDHALILIPLCILQFFSGLGGVDIYWYDEAKNATSAKEMLASDELIVPTFNCQLHTDKPPLHYYFMMAGYKIFGVGPLGARFFSGLFGLLTVLLIYLATARIANPEAGLLAAASLGLSLHFPIQMKQAVPDPYLIFFLTSAVLGIFAGKKLNKPAITYGGYVALGLAVLSKGPVAIILTGLSFLILLMITRKLNWREISSYRPISGGLVTLLIAVPWYVAVDRATGGAFTQGFFLTHNFGRYFNPMDGQGGIFLLTWLFALAGFLPTTVYLFQSLQYAWQGRFRSDAAALAFSAFVAVLIVFTFSSTRQPNYTAPAYPFAAMLVGIWMNQTLKKSTAIRRRFLIPSLIVFFLSVGLMLGTWYGFKAFTDTVEIANYAFFLAPGVVFGILSIIAAFKRRETRALIYQGSFALWTSLTAVYIILPKIDSVNPIWHFDTDVVKSEKLACYRDINPAWIYRYGCIDMYQKDDLESLTKHVQSGKYRGIISLERYNAELNEHDAFEIDWKYRDFFTSNTTAIYRLKDEEQ